MTRGPLLEGEESGDFRGGSGGDVNSFCKNTEGATEIMHTADLPRTASGDRFLTNRGWFYIFELGQSILLGVIAVQHKPARRSV